MVKSTVTLALLATTLSAVYAAPLADSLKVPRTRIPSGAAGVTFVPDAGPGCDMSTNPGDTTQPEVYNLTSSTGCITPSYAFNSYVETANAEAASGHCAVSIFSERNCTGTFTAMKLTTYSDCIAGPGASGMSVNMACGP